MSKKLSFATVFLVWCAFAVSMLCINQVLWGSKLLVCITCASLGILLLVNPVYPKIFRNYWSERDCLKFIGIIALLEILVSFGIYFFL